MVRSASMLEGSPRSSLWSSVAKVFSDFVPPKPEKSRRK
jgi:hypothetical protein